LLPPNSTYRYPLQEVSQEYGTSPTWPNWGVAVVDPAVFRTFDTSSRCSGHQTTWPSHHRYAWKIPCIISPFGMVLWSSYYLSLYAYFLFGFSLMYVYGVSYPIPSFSFHSWHLPIGTLFVLIPLLFQWVQSLCSQANYLKATGITCVATPYVAFAVFAIFIAGTTYLAVFLEIWGCAESRDQDMAHLFFWPRLRMRSWLDTAPHLASYGSKKGALLPKKWCIT